VIYYLRSGLSKNPFGVLFPSLEEAFVGLDERSIWEQKYKIEAKFTNKDTILAAT
jgi:hypothetical protein